MPRRGFIPKREVLPDPVYGTTVITKLINQVMYDGKRGVAQAVCYDAFATVAAKTGTTETGTAVPDAVFICYAPADDPEIAMAVVVEKGNHGADLAPPARQVLDYYFSFQQSTQQIENELSLLH